MGSIFLWLSARIATLAAHNLSWTAVHIDDQNISLAPAQVMEDPCEPIYANKSLYSLIVFVGSVVSIIAALENSIIFCSLAVKKEAWTSYFQYLILLAFFEALLGACYVPLFVVDVLAERYRNLNLMRAWWSYYDWMMATCHIAMTASSLLILAATFERYLVSVRSKWSKRIHKHRPVFSALAVVTALAVKAPIAFEMTLVRNNNCTGMNEFYVSLVPLAHTFAFGTIYRFWTRNIIGVFAPFFLLAFFNYKIFKDAKVRHRRASLFHVEEYKYREQLRAATRTLLFVVCIYLLTNTINVVVTALEFICMDLLHAHYVLYGAISDVVSFVTVLSCGLRLPIYLTCSTDLRQAILSSNCCSESELEVPLETRTSKMERNASATSLLLNGKSPMLIHLAPALSYSYKNTRLSDSSAEDFVLRETIV